MHKVEEPGDVHSKLVASGYTRGGCGEGSGHEDPLSDVEDCPQVLGMCTLRAQ